MNRLFAVVAALGSWGLAAAPAAAETLVFEFQAGLQGWQSQWHKDSPTGSAGMVFPTTERGYLDSESLRFDMGDGFGDDGTLWIERQVAVPAATPTRVALAFQLYSPFQSDFNNFQVKAAIGPADPELQSDFTTIGATDAVAGWAPYDYEQTVVAPTGQVWVALGIRVAWETHRDYWIDRVIVSTAPIPEPSTAVLSALAAAYARARRSRCQPPRTRRG